MTSIERKKLVSLSKFWLKTAFPFSSTTNLVLNVDPFVTTVSID